MIYIFDDLNNFTDEVYETIIKFIPDFRAEKSKRYTKDSDRKLCIISYVLLIYGVYKEYGIDVSDTIIDYQEGGKPYFKDISNIYFNISHSYKQTVCGISDFNMGVDIQNISDSYLEITDMVCSDNEIKKIKESGSKARLFVKYWTLKESYGKYTGIGIVDNLKKHDFSECKEKFTKYGVTFTVKEHYEYFISICSREWFLKNDFVIVSTYELLYFIKYFNKGEY